MSAALAHCASMPMVVDPSIASRCGLIVTGASGWIGSAVVQHAIRAGCVVVAASRRPTGHHASSHIELDLDRHDNLLAKAIEPVLTAAPVWAVIHCAGVAHVRVEDQQACGRMQHINVDGARRLVGACKLLGIQRIVNVSSISVYSWSRGRRDRPLNEGDPVGPETVYGKTKLTAEKIIENSKLDWRTARLATVFGSGDKANFFRLAKAIRQRHFLLPGSGNQRKSCIAIDTAAQALVAMALVRHPTHRLMNLAIPQSPDLAEITARIAGFLHAPAPPKIPLSALRVAARCGSVLAQLNLPTPITTQDLDRLCTWTWVDSNLAAEMIPELKLSTFAGGIERAAAYYSQC